MKSQLQIIINQLNETGEISRNDCLKMYISRLGARINDLKVMGWDFKTETRPTTKPDGTEGKDFVYIVTYKPTLLASQSPKSAPGSTKSPQDDPRQGESVKSDYKGELMQAKLIWKSNQVQ
jgi:hypothetical protein